jgi:UDP-N-acetylmuramoyl-tripeptide--D-alanyl-D-alanine ligase
MIPLTLEEISVAINAATLNLDSNLRVTGKVVIDSRKVSQGDLFVAINGEKVDGHDFCHEAIKKGAIAVISSKELVGIPTLLVKEGNAASKNVDQPTVIALGKLASYLLMKLPNIFKIAVTGSSGKTTTKDLLFDLGNLIGPTVAPVGSYNNEIGMPQTILECDEKTKVLILEMGAREVGNIKKLCQIAKPDTSILLNIGSAHIEIFGSRELILKTKSEIIECLNAEDVAVLNHEDETFSKQKTKAKVVSFGLSGADVSAKNVVLNDKAQASYELEFEGKVSQVNLKLVGAHQVSNSLAAAAVFLKKGLDIDLVAKTLSNSVAKSKWRMQVEVNSKNVTVINDSYNANPESMKAAIRTLKQAGADKKTFIIVGEMLELGSDSKQMHEEVADLIQKLDVKKTLVVGNGAKIVSDYLSNNAYKGRLEFCMDIDSAISKTKEMVEINDVVLVKASRAIGLERVANALMNDFSENLTNTNNQEVGP